MKRRRCRWESLKSLKRFHGLMIINGFFSNSGQVPASSAAAAATGDDVVGARGRELLLSALDVCGVQQRKRQPGDMMTMDYALKILQHLIIPTYYRHKPPEHLTFMWNSIIKAAAHGSTPSLAISIYSQYCFYACSTPIRPDSFTFLFLLKACTKLSSPSAASQFHALLLKFGFQSDVLVRNALIHLHAACGDIAVASSLYSGHPSASATTDGDDDIVARSSLIAGYARRGQLAIARRLFDETPANSRDIVSWNIMISGYANQGDMENARQVFDQAPQRDVVSWNTMISGYAKCGCHAKALEMYQEMVLISGGGDHPRPDEATMLCLLASCADSGDLDIGKRIHCSLLGDMEASTSTEPKAAGTALSVLHANALIDMYAKGGAIDKAMRVFKEMRERDVWTWNSIIGGLALHGCTQECMSLFAEMHRSQAVRPNEVTFICLLGMCSHSGMVDQGRKYFDLMMKDYGMEPTVKHYGCMVDLLGRAGLLEEAFEFVGAMKIEPSPVIWRTLLGACKVHGNVVLGQVVSEKLRSMGCHKKGGDYVLLSNIYSASHEWDGAAKVRMLMDERGVKKEAACSFASNF